MLKISMIERCSLHVRSLLLPQEQLDVKLMHVKEKCILNFTLVKCIHLQSSYHILKMAWKMIFEKNK